jgi:hypothetical protein
MLSARLAGGGGDPRSVFMQFAARALWFSALL